ncbi:MAG TPA: EF-P lysine aminoacylase EpmA [Candidatus Baltobacteraceae bacterium]|nr:EF-P lysine aminoacylase EpmA [Candidatus Baltobacteraceae bacterium]
MEHRWKKLKESAHLRQNLQTRAKAAAAVRAFFDAQGYMEVETPSVVAKPGMEPHLDPFETTVIDPFGNRYPSFLITSPEYAMKKLLVAGFPKIYQLAKCFRNGEAFEGRHNPEFTMLEWYRTGTDYVGIMDETEALVKDVAAKSVYKTIIERNGAMIDLAKPWERLTVKEAMRRHAGIDLDAALDDKSILLEFAKSHGHVLPEDTPWDDAFFLVFLNDVEPLLGLDRPTFLYEYPVSMAALSKAAKDPRYAERFELYIGGLEIANAFTELTDAKEQRKRLEEERALRKKLGRTDYGPDEDFLAALEDGMPEAGGIALGFDRLLMLLLGEDDIRHVTAFPADSMFMPEDPEDPSQK